MGPLAVDLSMLLRILESEVRVAPGRVLMARVVENQDPAKAKLSIAGKLLDAQLPGHLKEGEEVRLTVREVTADRVVLSLSPPLSGEAQRQSRDFSDLSDFSGYESEENTERGDRDRGPQAVTLRYAAPTIGPVDVRLQMHEGMLQALVAVRAGQVHALAEAEAAALRERLTAATGLAVDLVIQPRHEPIELYA